MNIIYSFMTTVILVYSCRALETNKTGGNTPLADGILDIETENSKLLNLIINVAKATETSLQNVQVPISNRLSIVHSTRQTSNRPFFAGQTGRNSRPQLIPPGTPWPQTVAPSQSPQLADRFTDLFTVSQSTIEYATTKRPTFKPQMTSSNKPPPKQPPRPSFAGQTGGNIRPQLVPSGTPWPAQAENNGKPELGDRFQETSKRPMSPGFIWNTNHRVTSTFPPLIRPTNGFSSGGTFQMPQTVNSHHPKPVIEIVDRIKETTNPSSYTEITSIPTRPPPNRPFYAGQTGGNYRPQLIPPGKPWPARPEDYTSTSITTKIAQVYTKRPVTRPNELKPQSTVSGEPEPTQPVKLPIEPSMLELEFIDRSQETSTLSNVPSTMPSTESEISTKQTADVQKLSTANSMKENPTTSKNCDKEITKTPTRPQPNRPPFAGTTGGNFKPQIIPPGTPWPGKPEEKTTKHSEYITTPLSLLIGTTLDENSSISDKTTGAPFTSKPISTKKL